MRLSLREFKILIVFIQMRRHGHHLSRIKGHLCREALYFIKNFTVAYSVKVPLCTSQSNKKKTFMRRHHHDVQHFRIIGLSCVEFWSPKVVKILFGDRIQNQNMNVLISKGRPRNNDLWNWFSLDLGVQMRWYLDWDSFRAWKTFSKILVNRCWLNIDIEAPVVQKWVKNG